MEEPESDSIRERSSGNDVPVRFKKKGKTKKSEWNTEL